MFISLHKNKSKLLGYISHFTLYICYRCLESVIVFGYIYDKVTSSMNSKCVNNCLQIQSNFNVELGWYILFGRNNGNG